MRGLLAAVGAAMVILLGAPMDAVAASEDVFVVPRVPVQAAGDSANAAKSAAQMAGRRRAMDILLRRLTIESDWVYLPRLARGEAASAAGDPGGKTAITLTDNGIEALESGFEVYSEKSSATSYRAFITYRFKPDSVRRLLKNARLPYSETQMRKALVVPVLETDKGAYLWEANNPWMAAWKARPYINELTPMTAPLGDLEDASAITARQALALDSAKMQALADKYNVTQVVLAHARLKQSSGQDQLTVKLINAFREIDAPAADGELDPTLVQFDPSGAAVGGERSAAPSKVGDLLAQTTISEASGNFSSLAERAIESAIGKYSSAWKSRTLIDHSHEAILEATAFFESLGDWTKIRAGLLATPLVGSVQVFALSPRGAEMRLKVFGDPTRLSVAMENYGVEFWTEGNQRWFLATPNRARTLKGSRALQRVFSDGNYNREDPSAPQIDNAIEMPGAPPNTPAPDASKIEKQSYN
jgi:hypothetical protein